MTLEHIDQFSTSLHLDEILAGDFDFFIPMIYLFLSISLYSIIIWHFYRYIARKNCFKISYKNHAVVMGVLKYFLIYPFVAFLFFTGFSLMLLFLTKNLEISQILATSFALIMAIRITAYYNEDLSKDVAKMLPFALLGLFLIQPSYFNIEDILLKVNSLPSFFTLTVKFILFIVATEWIMRIFVNVKRFIHHQPLTLSQSTRSIH